MSIPEVRAHYQMITDRSQLTELARRHAPPATTPADPPVMTNSVTAEASIWLIPPPTKGAAYPAAEVARIAGVSLATVRAWVSRGLKVEGQPMRLRTLRAPRGRIAPADLCEFLSAVNEREVRIERLE